MRVDNNWFKIFALMTVAGVAKSLFGPPTPPRITYNQAVETVKELKGDDRSEN